VAINFNENVTLFLPEVQSLDRFQESEFKQSHGLIVEVAAIHAGVTANYNYYSDVELERSLESWLSPYPKPIIINHDINSDPIGRIVGAKMDQEPNGSPFVRLQAAITDPIAVERVMDKRYLTGSVGGKAEEAVCSVCGVDWALPTRRSGAPCAHSRGESYKGKVAMLEMRNISFKEYSFVNVPADSNSTIRVVSNSILESELEADSYKPTSGMVAEARRGLDWRDEYNRGGTGIGIARARDIVNGKSLPLDTVKRMHSFFARHEVDKKATGFNQGEEGYPSNGRIAWALWGGDAGMSWSSRITASAMGDESFTEADAPSVGTFVKWNASGGIARGKVIRIVSNGVIKVPDSSFKITGTPEDPALLIQVWKKDGNSWSPTDVKAGHRSSTVSTIPDLDSSDHGMPDPFESTVGLFILDLNKESIIKCTEAEDFDILLEMKKKEASSLHMKMKGAFIEAQIINKISEEVVKRNINDTNYEDGVENSSEENLMADKNVPDMDVIEAVTKRDGGEDFPAAAFAYVPDPQMPSTWKLRLWDSLAQKETIAQVSRAVSALRSTGFRGNKVQIPREDLAAVKAKIRAAWKKVNGPDRPVPDILKESAESEMKDYEDDILEVIENLSADLSAAPDVEEAEEVAEELNDEIIDTEIAEGEEDEEEEIVEEEQAEDVEEGERPEGQEKSGNKDVDPETSAGAPVSRESEEDEAEEGTAEEPEAEESATQDELIEESELTSDDELDEPRIQALENKVRELEEINAKLKNVLHRTLVERVVDTKISLGIVEHETRADAIEEHAGRTGASLADTLRDLASMPSKSRNTVQLEVEESIEVVGDEHNTVTTDLVESSTQPSVEERAENLFVDILLGKRKA
jgi:hypothetical protein